MFDLAVVTRAVHLGRSVAGRRRVCIERATDLIALVVEVAVGGSLIVFFECYWEAYPAVVRVDFHMMTVLVVLEVVQRSMTAEACLAYQAGNFAGNRAAKWHIACCHNLPHSELLIQRRHQRAVVSSPYVRSVLVHSVLRDCMPTAQVDATAAAAAAVAVLVAERWLLLQTAPILVGLGTNAPKLYFLLEDGNVSRSQSFPAVGLQDSWSRDVQPSLPSKMLVHCGCPTFPVA